MKLVRIPFCAFLFVLFLVFPLLAQAPDKLWTKTSNTIPPLNLSRVIGELAVGTAGGAVLGIGLIVGVGSLVELLDPSEHSSSCGFHVDEHFERNAAITIGCGYVGYVVGSALGTYLVGNLGNETGSFIETLGTSALAGLLLILPAPIGATIGFNKTRGYKNPHEMKTGFLNYEAGELRMASPSVSSQTYSFDGAIKPSINLVNIEF